MQTFGHILTEDFMEDEVKTKSLVQITKEVGCSYTTTKNYVKKYNIKLPCRDKTKDRKEYNRIYHQLHEEKRNAYTREAYQKNREERIAYTKEWIKINPELKNMYNRNYCRRKRFEVINLLGGKCIKCGFEDERALQIDHIHGGGNKEFKKIGFGARFHRHILKLDEEERKNKYQLLCANCNWIKRRENKEEN